MSDNNHDFKHIATRIVQTFGLGIVFVLAIILGGLAFFAWLIKGCDANTKTESKIEITPTQIAKIENIGQWEFLSVSDEELVDTVRHGFFGDDELSRIYYGTIRLGIDLNETDDEWIKTDHDTITAILPPIKILDHRFIDEARTKAFNEEGTWTEKDKAALTRKAERIMKARCMTPANLRNAEQSALQQMTQLLHSMGFEYTKVSFKHALKR